MNNTCDLFSSTTSETLLDLTKSQEATIRRAIRIIESRMRDTDVFTSPAAVARYCQLHIATERDEHFGCLFLNTRHQLITFERLFRGTVDGASVYPRVIVRRSLELNASAVIFVHNHPSGVAEPSRDDVNITSRLKEALNLVDVRVLDHVVVGVGGTVSMAERGLL